MQHSIDITDLINAKSLAERSNLAKSEFLAKISHEIRTPMNSIMGFTELALKINDINIIHEYARNVKQASTNLLAIINDILDISKIETGKLQLSNERYSTSSLIYDVVSIIRMKMIEQHIRLSVKIDSSIPYTLIGDEIRIRQILINLLGNALKYTEKGLVSFKASMKIIDKETLNFILVVEDTGIGIKEADIDKLFTDFIQLDYNKNKNIEGVGLGLPITKAYVEAMHGTIKVKSEYGKGSKFTVIIPQKYDTLEPIASVSDSKNKKILLFDRRSKYSEAIIEALENLELNYTYVSNEDQLYEKLSENTYHFLLIPLYLYKQYSRDINENNVKTKIVILAELGETTCVDSMPDNMTYLTVPAYSVTIANVLNNVTEKFSIEYCSENIMTSFNSSVRVLVVDDIESNLLVAKGLLEQYNLTVITCKSGIDSLNIIKSKDFDIIFMDHRMPIMDGIETTQNIRQMASEDIYYKNVPIIGLTANAIEGTKEMFLECGFDDFMTKPINIKHLISILNKHVVMSEVIRENQLDNTYIKIDRQDDKLMRVVQKDISETSQKLKQAYADSDFKMLGSCAHILSSLLANIGFKDAQIASEIEIAALNKDIDFIKNNIEQLLSYIDKISEEFFIHKDLESSDKEVVEDIDFFNQQILFIKKSCQDYNIKEALAIVEKLKKKPWKPDTEEWLDNIHDLLYMFSDFDEVIRLIDCRS
jgi:CheY-like chemotaxis protein/nitrogen-specific signal transduction histidine kinase